MIQSFDVLFSGVFIVLVFIFLASAIKLKGIGKAVNHFSSSGSLTGITLAVVFVICGCIFLFALTNKAEASQNWSWMEYTAIYAGVEFEAGDSFLFCERGGVSDRAVSNIGLKQHLVTMYDIEFFLNGTHHSCVTNADTKTYNAVGVQFEWRFYWWK